MPANEYRSVTDNRVFLGAHHGNAIPRHAFFKSFDSLGKYFRCRQAPINNLSVFVAGEVWTSRPEFFPQVNVVDAFFVKYRRYDILAAKITDLNPSFLLNAE